MIVVTTLAGLLSVVFFATGATMVFAVGVQRANAEHLGFTVTAFRWIGVLSVLGAIGVLLGLEVPAVGIFASAGLVALMIGATVMHLRVDGRGRELVPPIATAVIAVAYLIAIGLRAAS